MNRTGGTAPEDVAAEVRRKAERLLRSRRTRSPFWSQLVHVGVLGWMFILPTVLFAAAGHLVGRATGRNGWAVAGVVIGVLVGAYVAWRHVAPTLEDPEPRAAPDETDEREPSA